MDNSVTIEVSGIERQTDKEVFIRALLKDGCTETVRLPKSQITVRAGREVAIELPAWLARDRGLRVTSHPMVTQPPAARELRPVADGRYTVVIEGEARTLKFETEQAGDFAGKQIVSYLMGPDNTSDYQGFAHIDYKAARVIVWRKRVSNPANDARVSALNFMVEADLDERKRFGQAYALASGNCYRCGRDLTVESSIEAGLGPVCAKKFRAELGQPVDDELADDE